MPPAAGAGPAPARTQLGLVASVPANLIEARFDIDRDSPVITSWCFIDWDVPVAPARASAPRSIVVGAILLASLRPTEQEQTILRGQPFLTHEMDEAAASDYLHALDVADAFDTV